MPIRKIFSFRFPRFSNKKVVDRKMFYSIIDDSLLLKTEDYQKISSGLPFHYYYHHSSNYSGFVTIKQQCPIKFALPTDDYEGYFYSSTETICFSCQNRLSCLFSTPEEIKNRDIQYLTNNNEFKLENALLKEGFILSDSLKYIFFSSLAEEDDFSELF